jgi:MazG family protein
VSVLDGIPPRLPALHEAHKISSRVARQGFDWDSLEEVLDKLTEETEELRAAAAIEDEGRRSEEVEEEIGDMLFVIVNVARHLGIDSESALKRSNRKFRKRFRHVEDALSDRGRALAESSHDELEELWQQAKAGESASDEA